MATGLNEANAPQTHEGKTIMSKTLGLIIISPFADWEAAILAAMAREWFGVNIVWIAQTPHVTSMGGLTVARDRDTGLGVNKDLDAVAIIGSASWEKGQDQDVVTLVTEVHQRGGVVAAICGGVIPLARSGLLSNVAHTSNDPAWLNGQTPNYQGLDKHIESSAAVVDGRIITASALAPVTFAQNVLSALLPEQAAEIAAAAASFASEHAPR